LLTFTIYLVLYERQNYRLPLVFCFAHRSTLICYCYLILIFKNISGGATPGRARSNDVAGRSTALAPDLAPPCLLLCFASVGLIVWTENKNFTISDRWPLYLFNFDSEPISAALAAFVFWGRRL